MASNRHCGIRPPTLALALLAAVAVAQAQAPPWPGDRWLTNAWRLPTDTPVSTLRSNLFTELHGEVIAERFKVLWPSPPQSEVRVVVRASTAELGHWPARDWRDYPMQYRGSQWEAEVPVEELDVPLTYFVKVTGPAQTNTSPMRVFAPRAAGLEMPTRHFWPFLEGFEEGISNWRLLSGGPAANPLRTVAEGRSGQAALLVDTPANRPVTLATTRVRGWQLQFERATGVRVWLRARQGSARARVSLRAHAFDLGQVVATWPVEVQLGKTWQKLDLPFAELPDLPLGATDLFTIEFNSANPAECLVDDLQLLGPWQLVPE